MLGEPCTLYTVAVACNCHLGNRFVDAPKKPKQDGRKPVEMTRYDPNRMLKTVAKDEAAQAELRTWVAERCSALSGPVPWTPPNFDDRDYTVTDDDFGPL